MALSKVGERSSAVAATVRGIAGRLALFSAAAVVLFVGHASPAIAGTPSPARLGECLATDRVWLHVQTETDVVLRSECVGRPSTGIEALRAADVATTEARGGYLCTLAGHPQECPGRFDGRYWQYSHAASAAAPWRFASRGAAGHRPQAGTVEGWCYNARDEERCELPRLQSRHPASPRVDIEAPDRPFDLWLLAGLVLMMGAFVWWARRVRDRDAERPPR